MSASYPDHGKYEWLPILYDFVATVKPKKIIEFGPGSGYTTICMAKALQENNIDGHINSYDIWDDAYWGRKQTTQHEYEAWSVSNFITLEEKNFYDWVADGADDFDFLYFDINNTSEKLLSLYDATKEQIINGSVIFFEGGSKQRDSYGHNGGGMFEYKERIGYKILTGNVKYSASAIYNPEKWELDFS
tara:strand:+ start:129 stop:695 length:567 start_codon:yes stop_codon:yes gene_type:complete